MNNPFDILIKEHDIISNVSHSLGKLEKLKENDPVRFEEQVRSLLIFFREYSDKFHHHKEELILFPAMNQHPDFMQQEIIQELEEHHENFRMQVGDIESALDNKNYEKVLRELRSYLSDLLDHIAVENDELFIMAESLFSQDELDKMYFRFIDLDRELGDAAKEALAKIPDEIEKTALPE